MPNLTVSVLTPLQLDAGYGLLQNQGITISPKLQAAINAYLNTPLISALFAGACAGSALLETINKRIETLYDVDHTIGHAYFIKIKDMDPKNQFEELIRIFKNNINFL